jgi:predicted 3-demethylubiquinone-9 3-methyltransferase (glyoxalase superfamily)
MADITPFIWFESGALEAAEFYTSLFPDSAVQDISYYGEGAPLPSGTPMVVTFTLAGRTYRGINGGPDHVLTEAFSMQIDCDDQEEADRLWDVLTDQGGRESRCGWLVDRFGLSWQVVPRGLPELLSDPDPGRSRRALQAMLGMSRLDLAAMRAAADAGD